MQLIVLDVSKWDYKEMLQTKSSVSCLSSLRQPEEDKLDQAAKRR